MLRKKILDWLELCINILPLFLRKRLFKIINIYLLRRNFNIYSFAGVTFLGIIRATHPKNLLFKEGSVLEPKIKFENERIVIVEKNETVNSGSIIKADFSQQGTCIIGSKKIKEKSDPSNIVFVLGTGRSGTNSIIKTINQNKKNHGIHEPSDELTPLAFEYLAKKISRDEANYTVQTIINQIQKRGRLVISDHKLVPFIDFLGSYYPNAKFIWLIRNPADVVNSGYHRGWFADVEFGYERRAADPRVYSSKIFSKFRINGYICNEFREHEWREMDAFERNCWYWRYWNQLIESQLMTLNRDRWMALSLEKLNNRIEEVASFFGEDDFDYTVAKSNQATYKLTDLSDWPEKWNNHLNKYCEDYFNHLKQDYAI